MEKSFGQNDPRILAYVEKTFAPEDSLLADIRKRADAAGLPPIHVGRFDGLHLEVIARAAGARKAVEIGTLAGYSGTCIARGLAEGGILHTFEADRKHAEVARETFRRAGFERTVRIHVGPALDHLPEIESEGPFDLVFIDADKASYPRYFKWAERNLRVGGIVLADNTFAWGMIVDERIDDPEDRETVAAIREMNRLAADPDGRFRSTMLPTAEGLTFAVKAK